MPVLKAPLYVRLEGSAMTDVDPDGFHLYALNLKGEP